MRTVLEIAERLGLNWDELQRFLNRGELDGVRLDASCLHKARRAFVDAAVTTTNGEHTTTTEQNMASAAQAAKHIFMSERNFMTLLDSGAMTRAPRDEYNLDKVRKERLEYLEAKRNADEGGGSSPLSDARTRAAVARAESVEFENKKTKREWIKLNTAVEWMIAVCTVIRELLLTLPGKMAAAVEGQPLDKIEDLLMDEVRAILTELSDPRSFLKRTREELDKGTITLDTDAVESLTEPEKKKGQR